MAERNGDDAAAWSATVASDRDHEIDRLAAGAVAEPGAEEPSDDAAIDELQYPMVDPEGAEAAALIATVKSLADPFDGSLGDAPLAGDGLALAASGGHAVGLPGQASLAQIEALIDALPTMWPLGAAGRGAFPLTPWSERSGAGLFETATPLGLPFAHPLAAAAMDAATDLARSGLLPGDDALQGVPAATADDSEPSGAPAGRSDGDEGLGEPLLRSERLLIGGDDHGEGADTFGAIASGAPTGSIASKRVGDDDAGAAHLAAVADPTPTAAIQGGIGALRTEGFASPHDVPATPSGATVLDVRENLTDIDAAPGRPEVVAPDRPGSPEFNPPGFALPGLPDAPAPGRPNDVVPGRPDDAAPAPPTAVVPGQPNDTAPARPDLPGPGRPSDISPGRPSDAAPGPPADVAPGRPDDAGPGRPNETAPGRPDHAGPGRPDDAGPGRPSDAAPGPPADVAPGRPDDAGPGRPNETAPGRPDHAGPGRPDDAGPGRPSDAAPGPPADVAPGRPDDAGPGRPNETAPGRPDHAGPGRPADVGTAGDGSAGDAWRPSAPPGRGRGDAADESGPPFAVPGHTGRIQDETYYPLHGGDAAPDTAPRPHAMTEDGLWGAAVSAGEAAEGAADLDYPAAGPGVSPADAAAVLALLDPPHPAETAVNDVDEGRSFIPEEVWLQQDAEPLAEGGDEVPLERYPLRPQQIDWSDVATDATHHGDDS
ncbi:MAG: hypothetical protein EA356_02205 [Geminicoccaceae bacterium]|nr:MAG: hypothetical protein EA356_02205 [Geminicoccaceae bacterium]